MRPPILRLRFNVDLFGACTSTGTPGGIRLTISTPSSHHVNYHQTLYGIVHTGEHQFSGVNHKISVDIRFAVQTLPISQASLKAIRIINLSDQVADTSFLSTSQE